MGEDVKKATRGLQTPRARLSYSQIFEAKSFTQPGQAPREAKFSCTLIFDAAAQKTAEFAALKRAASLAAEEKFGAKIKDADFARALRSPFHKSDTHPTAKGKPGHDPGTVFIRVTAKEAPAVVDTKLRPITDRSQVYSGCYVFASVNAFGYENSGNRGVSFGFNGIQKVQDGEPLGTSRRPEDMFKPIEGADDGAAGDASAPAESLFGE